MLNQKSQTLNVAYLPDCHLWIVYHFAIAVPNACLIVYSVAFNANGYRWPMQIECGRHAWLHTIWTERKSACSIDFHMWQLRLQWRNKKGLSWIYYWQIFIGTYI